MTEFLTPTRLRPDIIDQRDRARAAADQLADRWRTWADTLNSLVESMPPVPAPLRIRDHCGAMTDVEPGTTHDYRKAMRRALREARDHADAYAATIARTFQRADTACTLALSELLLWEGQRYFPATHLGAETPWQVVIDTAEDGTGFWEYTSDPKCGADCFDDYADAAVAARELNANPQPYPREAPRGRYIPWRGAYVDYEVIDRGDHLDQWLVCDTARTLAEAAELAKAFTTGTRQPPEPVAGGQAW